MMRMIPKMLKSVVFASCFMSQFSMAQGQSAELKIKLPSHFVKIDRDDRDDRNYRSQEDIKSLRKRVRVLEDAIEQLQEEIYYIRYRNQMPLPPEQSARPVETKPVDTKRWACVATGQNETFLGKGETKVEALANAKKSCASKHGGFWCSADESKCENSQQQ